MKYLFVIALEKEAKIIKEHYNLDEITNNYYKKDNIELIITDISRNGITGSLINLLYDYDIDYRNYTMINVGMVGSNNLRINDVYMVNNSYGYNFDLTPFGDPLYKAPYSPYKMDILENEKLADCYTSDSFVTSTDIKTDALFDMELNSIVTFPFKKKYSIKVISDSLNDKEFNEFKFDKSLPKIYEIVNKIIAE